MLFGNGRHCMKNASVDEHTDLMRVIFPECERYFPFQEEILELISSRTQSKSFFLPDIPRWIPR